ncbi:MAG TPA: efflux RND transporter periplasmic adaptor subunit [Acetobacteraceae bacterium]|jgi:membrane fusion protein, multidrug efflux system|nr:efflux RND transporter periplasmic adaptor subunit [Acetobacteraceae bacterium]
MAKHGGVRVLVRYVAGLGLVALAGVAAFHIWQQKDARLGAMQQALAQEVARGPRVQVVPIAAGPKERLITLLGDTRPWETATLYGKVAGYVKTITVDRGDHVTANQVLATVESPETDRQYDSAIADLENKRKNDVRARDLMAHGAGSIQAADQADANFTMAVQNVAQLAVMKGYEELRAPFDGVVTARFVDPGALVQNSTTNQASNQPVLTIADESRIRVDVYVAQRDVPFVHIGDMADVTDAADPSRKMQARIARTADLLDPRTRTLMVELDLDNRGQKLIPGSFAYVTLHVPLPGYPQVPVAALVQRGNNTFVADVEKNSLVHLQAVTVASTDGINASLAAGAAVGTRVALNLPDEVTDGSRVRAVTGP